MSDLANQAAALRESLPYDVAPQITVRDGLVEVLVYEEKGLARIRRAARDVGISDDALRIIRPAVFLDPFPNNESANEAAFAHFLAEDVRMTAEGAGVQLASMDPIVGVAPRVLILGSMPGEFSLASGEYYANRQNRFWKVMEAIFQLSETASYGKRVSGLTSAGVALWDVLKPCTRVGSLDSSIQRETEVPNDLVGFLERNPTVEYIVFNGQKAAASFHRLVAQTLPSAIQSRVRESVAPSTSAANARLKLTSIVDAWRAALNLTA